MSDIGPTSNRAWRGGSAHDTAAALLQMLGEHALILPVNVPLSGTT